MCGNRNVGTMQAQGPLTPLELLLSRVSLVLLGQSTVGTSCEKREKLRQITFSMGCWNELEVAFNPGRFLSGILVIGRTLQMSSEEVWISQ